MGPYTPTAKGEGEGERKNDGEEGIGKQKGVK